MCVACPKLDYHQKRAQRIGYLLHLESAESPVRLGYYFATRLPLVLLRLLAALAALMDSVKSLWRIPGFWSPAIDEAITQDDKWLVLMRHAKVDVEQASVRRLKWTRAEHLYLAVLWPAVLIFLLICLRNATVIGVLIFQYLTETTTTTTANGEAGLFTNELK